MEDLVALYSIKDKKPFFFIPPSEARIAIDYVKKVRSGFLQDKEAMKKQDEMVQNFMKQLPNLKPETKTQKEIEVIIHNKMDLTKQSDPLPLSYFEDPNPQHLTFCLSSINDMFAYMENLTNEGLTVDALILSAFRFADIRNMGRVVCDKATAQDAKQRGVFGHLFNADIYLCNLLGNTKIITGNTLTNTFILNTIQYPNA